MGRTFELVVKNTKEPTRLVDLDVDVSITGFLAKTTVIMIFKNETSVETEGELIFPLPDGAAMCAYAVDINGVLVDGVVIEKEKARVVFETEARKTVEKPQVSIAEQVVGNIFKTRIFPLPKQGTRTVKVSYVEELTIDQKHLASGTAVAKYELPLEFAKSIEKCSMSIAVDVSDSGIPTFRCDLNQNQTAELPRLEVAGDTARSNSRKFAAKFRDVNNVSINNGGIFVTIPSFKQTFIVDYDTDGACYFALRHPPVEEPVGGAKAAQIADSFTSQALAMMKTRIGILWDASQSRKSAAETAQQISLLRQMFSSSTESLRNCEVDLIVFRDRPEPAQTFSVRNGSSDTLCTYLERIKYDGGSNLGALDIRRGTQDDQAVISFYIMFSDGIHNVGPTSSPAKFSAPIFTVATSESTNHTLLRVWARKSGGEYFRLESSGNFRSIIERLSKASEASFSFISSEFDSILFSDVFPGIPTPLSDFTFKFAGKMIPRAIESHQPYVITFNYGYGTRVTTPIRCELPPPRLASEATPSRDRLAVRFWAQRKIEELQQFPEVPENKDLITEIGRKYSIVTENTSFIVLESLDAYLKYEIEPPESLVDVHKQWKEIMTRREREKREESEDILSHVLDFWRRRVAWWQEDVSNAESKEDHILHCFRFGDGVDHVRSVLGGEWTEWKSRLEQERNTKNWREARLSELAQLAVSSVRFSLAELSQAEQTYRDGSATELAYAKKIAQSDRESGARALRRARAIERTANMVRNQLSQLDRTTSELEAAAKAGKACADANSFDDMMLSVRDAKDKIVQVLQEAASQSASSAEIATATPAPLSDEEMKTLGIQKEAEYEEPLAPAAVGQGERGGFVSLLRKSRQGSPMTQIDEYIHILSDGGPPPPPPSAGGARRSGYFSGLTELQKPGILPPPPLLSGGPPPPPPPAPGGGPPPPPPASGPYSMLMQMPVQMLQQQIQMPQQQQQQQMFQSGMLPPMAPPPMALGGFGRAPPPLGKGRGGLLESIRSGTKLAKADVADKKSSGVAMPKDSTLSLMSSLSASLSSRRSVAVEESEDEDEGGWDDEEPRAPKAAAAAASSVASAATTESLFGIAVDADELWAEPEPEEADSRRMERKSKRSSEKPMMMKKVAELPKEFKKESPKMMDSKPVAKRAFDSADWGAALPPPPPPSAPVPVMAPPPPMPLSPRLMTMGPPPPPAPPAEMNAPVLLPPPQPTMKPAEAMPPAPARARMAAPMPQRAASPPSAPKPSLVPSPAPAPSNAVRFSAAAGKPMPSPAPRPAPVVATTTTIPTTSSLSSGFGAAAPSRAIFAEEERERKPSPIVSRDREKAKEEKKKESPRMSSFSRAQAVVAPPPAEPPADLFFSDMDSFADDAPAMLMEEMECKEAESAYGVDLFNEVQSQKALMPEQDMSLDQMLMPMEKVQDLTRDLNEIKLMMQENIDKVLERGDKLDSLIELSDELQLGAQEFHRKAVATRQKPQEENKLDEESEMMMQLLDPDRTGFTTLEAMFRAAADMGKKPDDEELAELVRQFGDPDGRIDLRKLLAASGTKVPEGYFKGPVERASTLSESLDIAAFSQVGQMYKIDTLSIRTPNGKIHKCKVNLAGNVSAMREAIATLIIARSDLLELKINDKEVVLEDYRTIKSYSIDYKTIVDVSLKRQVRDPADPDYVSSVWAAWRLNQPTTWAAFENSSNSLSSSTNSLQSSSDSLTEGEHFILMRKWHEARYNLVQTRIRQQLHDIEKEYRRTLARLALTSSGSSDPESLDSSGEMLTSVVRRADVRLPTWKSTADYLSSVRMDSAASLYESYIARREANQMNNKLISFFVDYSKLLSDCGDQQLALRVLSNLAELELDDPQPLRVMSFRLLADAIVSHGSFEPAIAQFRRVLQIRPEEPQSFMDLALALSREATRLMRKSRAHQLLTSSGGDSELLSVAEEEALQNQAEKLMQEAIDLMVKVVMGKWDKRFDQIQVTALTDLNRLFSFSRAYGFDHLIHRVDKRLLSHCDVDLRVVIQWDTDMTDIELHVVEPTGEHCSSWNNRTRIGGVMSRDFTKGYGPEEYMIKTAAKGRYQISTKLFQSLERIGGTTVVVHVYTNFARPGLEREYVSVIRLSKPKETFVVAEVDFN